MRTPLVVETCIVLQANYATWLGMIHLHISSQFAKKLAILNQYKWMGLVGQAGITRGLFID